MTSLRFRSGRLAITVTWDGATYAVTVTGAGRRWAGRVVPLMVGIVLGIEGRLVAAFQDAAATALAIAAKTRGDIAAARGIELVREQPLEAPADTSGA